MTNQTKLTTMNNLLSVVLFFAIAIRALALPGTGSNNLMTTSGVSTSQSGSTLTITAPNKSVLTWQAFGSGTDTIGLSDTVAYTLPSSTSSVLNIVAGGARTQIDGTISSNGNVFVLNPNGVVIGGGARIDTNALVISTSGDAAFANYYFHLESEALHSAGSSN